MTPLIVATALSLLALDATPASSTQATTVAPAQVSAPTKAVTNGADDPDRVICHKEAMTGSRFEKRICMTRAQWDEQQRQTADFERRLGEHPNAPMSGGLSGN